MKAVEFNAFGLEHLRVIERPEPVPKPREVLVRMEAVSLNALDRMVIDGHYLPDLPLPATPGCDAAGTVVAVGTEVTHWQPGDRVIGHFKQNWLAGPASAATGAVRLGVTAPGVLAEFVVLPEHGLVRRPTYLTAAEAATLPIAGLTAWVGLVEHGRLKVGQTVLVQGTGGVSIAALQLAKAAGARVIATTGSANKEAHLRALGADHVINYRQTPDWDQEVKRLTAGQGADITLDVAGDANLQQSLQAVKQNGMVGIVGFLSGGQATINLYTPVLNELTVVGFGVGSRQSFEDYLATLEITRIRPVIDRQFSLTEAPEAFDYLASGQHFGKVVITL